MASPGSWHKRHKLCSLWLTKQKKRKEKKAGGGDKPAADRKAEHPAPRRHFRCNSDTWNQGNMGREDRYCSSWGSICSLFRPFDIMIVTRPHCMFAVLCAMAAHAHLLLLIMRYYYYYYYFVSYKRHIKWNKASVFISNGELVFIYFSILLRTLTCQLNRPFKKRWREKGESIEVSYVTTG